MRYLISIAVLLFCATGALAQAPAGFTKLANVSAATYTDATCANQTTCYYVVTAVDATGHESPPSACGPAVLCFGGNQAVAVMPSSGTHTVLLTWTASPTAGVTYNVYEHTGPLTASNLNAVVQ